MNKKKSFSFNLPKQETENNQKAVTAVLNRRRPDPQGNDYPTRTQVLEPLPGQASLFDPETMQEQRRPAPSAGHAVIRRKSAERRTKTKQLQITPAARKNLRERAENEDISINECINQLTAAAIRKGMKVHREKKSEPKSCRQVIILTPSMLDEIETTAAAQGVSLNEFICYVLENCEKVKI